MFCTILMVTALLGTGDAVRETRPEYRLKAARILDHVMTVPGTPTRCHLGRLPPQVFDKLLVELRRDFKKHPHRWTSGRVSKEMFFFSPAMQKQLVTVCGTLFDV